ncbi:MAG: undecaprenyl-diphosphate phosphatase [Puniceicoccales bacterium]|jgi:undecaprenyl-diphosphatase|nr:undecaprenyl-diphosphate phosphatase [Puniceicoccales bacterium]
MKKFFHTLALLLISQMNLFADEAFTKKEAIIFGITQGITEYLPVSSTGHMILVDRFLLGNDAEMARDSGACAEMKAYAKSSYFCMLQIGSILAVLVLYRRRFIDIALGMFGHNGHGRKLALRLIISAIPAAVIGLFADGILQRTLYNVTVVSIALAIGAIIMLFAESAYGRRSSKNFAKRYDTVESLSVRQSFHIGLWQCLSLIPGISRSMTTVVGGYRSGLRRADAAEYSFLLGCVMCSAAVAYKFAKDFDIMLLCLSAKTFFAGILIAFFASAVAIRLFIAFISHYGIAIFAWYRIFLAVTVICITVT